MKEVREQKRGILQLYINDIHCINNYRSCIYAFKYNGHSFIARSIQSKKEKEVEQQNLTLTTPPPCKEKLGRKANSSAFISSPVQTTKSRAAARSAHHHGSEWRGYM